ncbi:MAG: hypothetical protein IRZ16_14530 [Myxococcaceae bacterium]|nr:hypothetical protein [Myxococcaceae bacterium]
MNLAVRCLVVTVAVTAGVTACAPETSLLLDVDPSLVPGTQQLHVTGRQGKTLVFGPTIRPESAGPPLEGPQSLRVVLRDEWAGRTITVRVEALVDGRSAGAAEVDVQAAKQKETRVELTPEPLELACANCDGCCQDGVCIQGSVGACGTGGVACFACDGRLADRCSETGRCACGNGPACSPITGADRCIDGECHCGDGTPCPAGTECDNGLCRCTPDSCAGCCNANSCQPGTVDNACGSHGDACVVCTAPQHCTAGTCQ